MLLPPRSLPVSREFRFWVFLVGALGLLVAWLIPVSAAAGVTIHPPEIVLKEYTVVRGGTLCFRSPQGDLWELVTDITDPAIANRGQGAFFPVDPLQVERALAAITYPLDGIDAEIFILPYPRRDLIPSNADDRAIYLSPGVAPLLEMRVHSLVAHEMGHIVQHRLLPDANREGWEAYRRLRGLEDGERYRERAAHRNRPHEIFAEDFRFLFGGALANYSGSIENIDLALPSRVVGLPEFLLSLIGSAGVTSRPGVLRELLISPNPSRGFVRLEPAQGVGFDAETAASIEVYDVSGRRVTAVAPSAPGRLEWDGKGEEGADVSPGIYFVRVRQSGRVWTAKVSITR